MGDGPWQDHRLDPPHRAEEPQGADALRRAVPGIGLFRGLHIQVGEAKQCLPVDCGSFCAGQELLKELQAGLQAGAGGHHRRGRTRLPSWMPRGDPPGGRAGCRHLDWYSGRRGLGSFSCLGARQVVYLGSLMVVFVLSTPCRLEWPHCWGPAGLGVRGPAFWPSATHPQWGYGRVLDRCLSARKPHEPN